MKTIYIVRHAKSSWAYDGVEDADRPLKKRGIQDAYLMANWLSRQVKRPDAFLSSYATRALCTATIFANVMQYPMSHLSIKKSLYNFSGGYLLKTIIALDDTFQSVIIFGHDHGISNFINEFGDKYINHLPTCGVVGIDFKNNHWKSIKKGKTKLIGFPKHHKK